MAGKTLFIISVLSRDFGLGMGLFLYQKATLLLFTGGEEHSIYGVFSNRWHSIVC